MPRIYSYSSDDLLDPMNPAHADNHHSYSESEHGDDEAQHGEDLLSSQEATPIAQAASIESTMNVDHNDTHLAAGSTLPVAPLEEIQHAAVTADSVLAAPLLQPQTQPRGIRRVARTVYNALLKLLVATWTRFQQSTATLSSFGNDRVSEAQDDLRNLKKALIETWTIKADDKVTTALLVANLVGKMGYTPLIIISTFVFATLKFVLGAACMFLGGDWINLLRRPFNTLKETMRQGIQLLSNMIGRVAKAVLNVCRHFINQTLNLAINLASIIKNSVARLFEKIARSLKSIWILGIDLVKAILNGLKSAIRMTFKVASNIAKYVRRGVNFIVRNAVLLFKNTLRSILKLTANVISSVIYTALSAFMLGLAVLRAAQILSKGVVLALSAIFMETGLATMVAGVARALSILDVAVVSSVGAFMDNATISVRALLNAGRSLFGFRPVPFQPQHSLEIEVAGNQLDLVESSYEAQGTRAVTRFNNAIERSGNYMYNLYMRHRNELLAKPYVEESLGEMPEHDNHRRSRITSDYV